MKLKLVINGEDKRVRITPDSNFDRKLLEMLGEANKANLSVHRETYGRDIDWIDLTLDFSEYPSKP